MGKNVREISLQLVKKREGRKGQNEGKVIKEKVID